MKSALLMFDNAAYADDLKALQKIKSADFEVTSIRPDQYDRLVSWINWVNKNTEGMSPYALSNEFVIITDTKKSETMIRKVKPLIQPRVYVASIRDENAYALFILDFFEKNDHRFHAFSDDVEHARPWFYPGGVDVIHLSHNVIASEFVTTVADSKVKKTAAGRGRNAYGRRVRQTRSVHKHDWDVFLSHAQALKNQGLTVWFDEMTLTVGDSLRRNIDRGLAQSKYGIVIISPNFLTKQWPQRELDGLTAREDEGRKIILPVWHNVDAQIIQRYSPTLADRLATNSAKGLDAVVAELLAAIREE